MTIDSERHSVWADMEYKPHIVPYSEQHEDDQSMKFVAPTVEEARKMAYKKLKRMNMTDEQIENAFEKLTKTTSEAYQPELGYDITIEFNRFYMEALKIAYEYAVCKLGDAYWEDETAKKIREYLCRAIKGEMKEECTECKHGSQRDRPDIEAGTGTELPCAFSVPGC